MTATEVCMMHTEQAQKSKPSVYIAVKKGKGGKGEEGVAPEPDCHK